MKDKCPYDFYDLILDRECVMCCSWCDKRTKILPEGFEVCKNCKGSGHIENKTKGFNCPKCRGNGRIGWTDKVVR